MFPRGAANLEEVPVHYVSRCLVPPMDVAAKQSTALLCDALGVMMNMNVGWHLLEPKEWARMMISCRSTRACLIYRHEWMGMLGYELIKQPENFSPSILLGILLQDPAFSCLVDIHDTRLRGELFLLKWVIKCLCRSPSTAGRYCTNNAHCTNRRGMSTASRVHRRSLLQREIMVDLITPPDLSHRLQRNSWGEVWGRRLHSSDRVRERVKAGATMVKLVAMSSAKDSVAFWKERLLRLLSLPKMPTGQQAEEAKKTVEILIDRETGIGVSTVMEACLSMEKANGTVGPVVIAAAIEATPRQPPSLSSNSRAPGAKATGKSETAAGGGKSSEKESGDDKVEQERPQAEYLTSGEMGAFLAKLGPTGIRTLIMLMGGVPVDSLKADVQTLRKLAGVRIPRVLRSAIVKALGGCSWFALLGVFRFELFFKNLFKSIHIVEVLKDADGKLKLSPEYLKVYLLQALLRAEKYPKSETAYNALCAGGRPWDKVIVGPLTAISRDPLFHVEPEWVLTGYQEHLAGKKIPRPSPLSVENLLCSCGNWRGTWHAILDCGQITAPQILRNMVNLTMMDFPVGRVQAVLDKSIERIPIADLTKVLYVLEASLSREEVLELSREAEKTLRRNEEAFANAEGVFAPLPSASFPAIFSRYRGKGGMRRAARRGKRLRREARIRLPPIHQKHRHRAPPGVKRLRSEKGDEKGKEEDAAWIDGDLRASGESDEVRVVKECAVGDKKGQRHEIIRGRTVSTRLSPETAGKYIAMLSSLLSAKMDTISARCSRSPPPSSACSPLSASVASHARGEVVGVISYTEELRRNVVRSGIPPSVPSYSNVTLWRGEDVCLSQLGAQEMEEFVVGITWCEPKDPESGVGRVDLDLSVMVYDESWNPLAHCSFDTPGLSIAGVTHSGDLTSAPYPQGARETCIVNIAGLLKGFPSSRYIVLAVYSYTHQEWDLLEDASVFVANPHVRGTGPGGMAVIGAARLTGAASSSIGGYLELVPRSQSAKPEMKTSSGAGTDQKRGVDAAAVGDGKPRVHFVFTDQATAIGACSARGSQGEIGGILRKMKNSRASSGAQTLADAAAFQAALVCDRVVILGDDVWSPTEMVKGEKENTFGFYRRLAAALVATAPGAPAAGSGGAEKYLREALRSEDTAKGDDANGRGARHTVFFGGDLDDWLQVTRQYGHGGSCSSAKGAVGAAEETVERGMEEPCLVLVNLRSSEKGLTKDEGNVIRVDGATAYEELVEAILQARTGGQGGVTS